MGQQNMDMDIGLDGPELVRYIMLIDQIHLKCQD
jgi:hypothetical protein